jgi:p-hydroxybenzoate 3-monooxygenase
MRAPCAWLLTARTLPNVGAVKTEVGIVGAGPAGLVLAHLLERSGIDCVVLENRSRAYVEQRVRAGLLEQNTTDLLREIGVGDRMLREGLPHDGIHLRFRGRTIDVPITELTGRRITVYGQQEVVKDLIASWLAKGGAVHFEVSDVAVHDIESDAPRIAYRDRSGAPRELGCALIAGCDGFHGVCRPSIPEGRVTVHEFAYPFAWLGILAEAAPSTEELIYAWHERGFALYSMRSPAVSRLYLQVPADEELAEWPDERIWGELQTRMAAGDWRVNEGPIVDKGITPMRSFVTEPMQYGRLFLAGDAAHIVPPTGAKGLNLAVNDVRLLAPAIAEFLRTGAREWLDAYSECALRRVWRAQDFSNYMTTMLHRLGRGAFEQGLQLSRLEYLARSETARRSLAENYAGLPPADDF